MSTWRLRVVLKGDGKRPDVNHAIQQVVPLVREHADLIAVSIDNAFDLKNPDYDLLINFGGDGSLLGVARAMGEQQRPVVGVNFGKIGFLASFELADLLVSLNRLLDPNRHNGFPRRSMIMLEACVRRQNGDEEHFLALNDAVISRGEVSRLCTLECRIDGDYVTHYAADGLIVATPAGTTAHSLSAGGPLVEPELNALVLTPICAHTLAVRPLVISGQRRVELRVEESHTSIGATFDGQNYTPMKPGDVLSVQLFPHQFTVLGVNSQGFYATLRSKLGWGGQLNRSRDSQRRRAILDD